MLLIILPNKDDINITAAMFTLDSFEAENYSTRGKCGFINLRGSLAQDTDGYTGSGSSGSGVSNGFNLNINMMKDFLLKRHQNFLQRIDFRY